MPKGNLTAKQLRELLSFNPDSGVFTWLVSKGRQKRGNIAGTYHLGYVQIKVDGKYYRAHRLAWLWVTGEWPTGEIDHRNGKPSDNRFSNLRPATHTMNQENRQKAQKNSQSGILGASPYGHRWRAYIRISGKTVNLGTFSDPEKAHQAYLEAKRKLHQGCTI